MEHLKDGCLLTVIHTPLQCRAQVTLQYCISKRLGQTQFEPVRSAWKTRSLTNRPSGQLDSCGFCALTYNSVMKEKLKLLEGVNLSVFFFYALPVGF